VSNRIGCLLVFKKHVTVEEATSMLTFLMQFLDVPATVCDPPYHHHTERRFVAEDLIEHFDDEDGGPVWYIP